MELPIIALEGKIGELVHLEQAQADRAIDALNPDVQPHVEKRVFQELLEIRRERPRESFELRLRLVRHFAEKLREKRVDGHCAAPGGEVRLDPAAAYARVHHESVRVRVLSLDEYPHVERATRRQRRVHAGLRDVVLGEAAYELLEFLRRH